MCVCAQSFVSILALFSRPPQRDGAQQKGGDVCWQAARGALPSGGRQVSSHWSTLWCSPLIGCRLAATPSWTRTWTRVSRDHRNNGTVLIRVPQF